ncbi:MAG: ABC transporter permease, partial [Gemmatimonadetes bacterium]|nr:ABC transporter permease [Gemmatimonadota bacterium]
LGKLVPFVLVGYVQMTVVIILGKLAFDMPIQGSLSLLYAAAFTFILASLGVGLFISTIARTQAQAMQLSFFFIMPNILLSGYVFPREAMPVPAQWIGVALPLTHFLKVIRRILLMGTGPEQIWREGLFMALIAAALVHVSVTRFSKTIE